MRFTKDYCPRPSSGRGRARRRYRMSDEALAQRRSNLRVARERGRLWRGYSESQAVRQLIKQWAFDRQPRLSERAVARELGVWPSYVRKVKDKALSEGADAVAGRRVTRDDLAEARRVTDRVREREPSLFAPSPQPLPRSGPRAPHPPGCECDACVCPFPALCRSGRRVLFSVPVR